jgi:predicted PurR-regulated permease PerM
MIVIFVGVIGGTLSFGIVGLFVGPVALGIGYKLLVEWTRRDGERQALEPGD